VAEAPAWGESDEVWTIGGTCGRSMISVIQSRLSGSHANGCDLILISLSRADSEMDAIFLCTRADIDVWMDKSFGFLFCLWPIQPSTWVDSSVRRIVKSDVETTLRQISTPLELDAIRDGIMLCECARTKI
jgi:hypothetical protein